jgi:hypothetical protein
VQCEKNLAEIGFFSPTNKKIKNVKAKIMTGFVNTGDGKRIMRKVSIIPAALYGLPTTAHQDKTIAFQSLLESKRVVGLVSNPVRFSAGEMLKLLGLVDSGENYKDIEEFIDVMLSTTVKLEGAEFLQGKRTKFAGIMFHVFNQAVIKGKKLPDGTVATEHQVWLSDWMLENVNRYYTVPIDFETYKRLNTSIAKALVPLLQVWLFASENEKFFEKEYCDLCELLNLTQYKYGSDIRKRFCPALDELKAHGYIRAWKLEPSEKGNKFIFYHGQKFYNDQIAQREKQAEARERRRAPKLVRSLTELALPQPEPSRTPAPETGSVPAVSIEQERLYKQLTGAPFFVSERKARELVSTKPDEVKKQLGAYPLKKNVPTNPGGYIIRAIEHGYFVPPSYFEAKRKAEEAAKSHARRDQIAACPLCDASGFRMVTDGKISGAKKCSHDPKIEARYPSL